MGNLMFKANRSQVLLLLVFLFAFIYRIVAMLWATFPPGADIGLHNSVIRSITQSGNTNFLYDFYQMGGGQSLTFPGYHIFASAIILATGMTDYVAQAVIVALFSSLIVLAAYLITRAAWTESGALIVAFLVAVSRFDMEMLLWGGYPNVITLLLIPLTLYLFLQKDRFSTMPFLVSTSILVGSIFLTHSLSAVIFVGIAFSAALLILVAPKTLGTSRKHVLYWVLPTFGGLILVSPFLASAIPAYLSANSAFTGTADIKSALLSTKIVPVEIIVPLFAILVLFFFLSKEYRGRYFSLSAAVFFIWLLVPLVLTQGYLFGLFVDYNRFLYFLLFPVLVLIGLFVDHGSMVAARFVEKYRFLTSQIPKTKKTMNKYAAQISRRLTRKTIYSSLVLCLLLILVLAVPLFVTPMDANSVQIFYQVMDNPSYQAIQWAKQNTPSNSVFVSDALYGWWFSGFAERPTVSAVDPQYLTVARELYPAKNASLLLDTDYMIDNGYVQVREDGGYIERHNPEILANLNWTYFPYSFFNFDSSQTQIYYKVNGTDINEKLENITLGDLSLKEMRFENQTDYKTIVITRGNDFFNYTQYTTVHKGSLFVNVTSTIDSTIPGFYLGLVKIDVQSKGTQIAYNNEKTIGMIDVGVKTFGQLIFAMNQPDITVYKKEIPTRINLQYSPQNNSHGEIQILASAYSADNNPDIYKNAASITAFFDPVIASNLNQPQQPANQAKSLTVFDYHLALQQLGVSYIANRVSEMNPKFASDPQFSLVFINNEVAIFKVRGNFTQVGSSLSLDG
jgi:hypothetical protein